MRADWPRGIEAVGIGPDRGVTVGGTEEELHAVALGEAMAVDLDLFERDAGEDVEGRIVAEDFLDHAFGIFGGWDHTVLEEKGGAVADGVDGGFVACVEEEDAGGDQLVAGEFLAVLFGGDELGDEIIGGFAAAGGDVILEEGDEFFGGFDCGGFDFGRAAGLIHGDHGVRPCKEVRAFAFGHAQKAGDDGDGEGARETVEKIVRAVGHGGDEFVGKCRDFGGERVDAARGEGAEHEAAQAGVTRRLQFQHGMGFDRVERREMGGRFGGHAVGPFAAEAAVTEEGLHDLVASGGGQAVVFPEKERAGRAGAVIEGVGIGDERRIVRGLAEALHGVREAAPTGQGKGVGAR